MPEKNDPTTIPGVSENRDRIEELMRARDELAEKWADEQERADTAERRLEEARQRERKLESSLADVEDERDAIRMDPKAEKVLAKKDREILRYWLALRKISKGEVPGVEFADDDLISVFAAEALTNHSEAVTDDPSNVDAPSVADQAEPVEAGVGEEAGPEPDGPKTFFDWATMEAILDALPGPLTATDRQPIPGGGLYPTRKRDLTRDEARGALTAALWKAIPAGVRS